MAKTRSRRHHKTWTLPENLKPYWDRIERNAMGETNTVSIEGMCKKKGLLAEMSPSTYRSARDGHSITLVYLRSICATVGFDFDVLIEEKPLPNPLPALHANAPPEAVTPTIDQSYFDRLDEVEQRLKEAEIAIALTSELEARLTVLEHRLTKLDGQVRPPSPFVLLDQTK